MKKLFENTWLIIKAVAFVAVLIIVWPFVTKAGKGISGLMKSFGFKKNFTDNEDGTITTEEDVDIIIPDGIAPKDVKEVFMPSKKSNTKENVKDEKDYSVNPNGDPISGNSIDSLYPN